MNETRENAKWSLRHDTGPVEQDPDEEGKTQEYFTLDFTIWWIIPSGKRNRFNPRQGLKFGFRLPYIPHWSFTIAPSNGKPNEIELFLIIGIFTPNSPQGKPWNSTFLRVSWEFPWECTQATSPAGIIVITVTDPNQTVHLHPFYWGNDFKLS